MKKLFACLTTLVVACVPCSGLAFDPEWLPIAPIIPASLDSLLGGDITQVGETLISEGSNGSFSARVCSAVYTGGNERFAYVYQVENTSPPGGLAIEGFLLHFFFGFESFLHTDGSWSQEVGYLTTTEGLGSEFLAGGVEPYLFSWDYRLDGLALNLFHFPADEQHDIPPGSHGIILYGMSNEVPKLRLDAERDEGGWVGPRGVPIRVPIWVPIPEPGVGVSLALGGICLAWIRRRRFVT